MPEPILCNIGETPWSWSIRRTQMFIACPRRAFFHYYATIGGHDPNEVSPRIHKLHLLKKLQSPNSYIRELLAKNIRDMFYSESGENFTSKHRNTFEHLVPQIWRSYRRETSAMWREEYKLDHSLPMLNSAYYNPENMPSILETIESNLKAILANSELKETLNRLFAIHPMQRVFIPRPMSVLLGASPLYCASTLAFKSDNVLVFIDLTEDDNLDLLFRDSSMLIHCYYGTQKLGLSPDKVVTSFLNIYSGKEQIPSVMEANFSAILNYMSSDRSQQLDLIRDDGNVYEQDFAPNLAKCKYCNFREECHCNEE